MSARVIHNIAPGDDPEFVPFGKHIACVSATSWTDLSVQLSQSADSSDTNAWIAVGSALTANGIVTLNGGLWLKAVATGAGEGVVSCRVAQTELNNVRF